MFFCCRYYTTVPQRLLIFYPSLMRLMPKAYKQRSYFIQKSFRALSEGIVYFIIMKIFKAYNIPRKLLL